MEGASVGDIFRYEGEERFRELERSVVERVAASGEACIVATGGGLPTWSDNMEMLSKAGTTVYLRRSAEQIAARLTPYGRAKRPKFRGSAMPSWWSSCGATSPSANPTTRGGASCSTATR